MLGRYAGKWGSHPNGHAIGFQHQHSLSAQSDIGFANPADVGANAFSYNLQRWPLPGLGEVLVDRQFRLRIETHALDLYYMPYTHSLVGALFWSAVAFAIYKIGWRNIASNSAALLVGF